MFKKSALLLCSLLAFGCGGKKKDDAAPPAPVADMKPADAPPKVDPPKVEPPRVAVEEPLMIEAVVVAVDGTVEVKAAASDTFAALAVDQDLAVGDHVRVLGDKGMVKLRMWDDTMVTLTAGAEAVINPGAAMANVSPSITVLAGTSSFMVEPRAELEDPFLVYTPSGILTVLGTEFEVAVADTGAMKVGVNEGLVQVLAADGADLTEVPQGKAVVVALDGEVSKPGKVEAYDAEKEDLEKFYEAEHKNAAKNVDGVTRSAAARLEAMKKHMEKLQEGIAKLEARADELAKKAEEKAAKDDQKGYDAEAAPLVETLDESRLAGREDQRVHAMMVANTYLLRRIDTLVAAGVIKPTPEQAKVIAESKALVEPWINDLDENTVDRLRARQKRDRRYNENFLKHHPEGRFVAEKTKVEQPPFYGKLPKAARDKVAAKVEPKMIPPVKFQLRPFAGKARAELKIHPKANEWKATPYQPADPARLERAKKVEARALKARPKTAVLIKMIPPKFRNRRPAGTGPDGAPMGPGDMGPEDAMGPDGMEPGDMGMGPEDMGMGPEGMGPEGMGPNPAMIPETMGPDVMGPAVMGPAGPAMGPRPM